MQNTRKRGVSIINLRNSFSKQKPQSQVLSFTINQSTEEDEAKNWEPANVKKMREILETKK